MRDLNLKPDYSSSHALIVGVNDYQHVAPLHFAVEDATAVAEVLRKSFGFPPKNVTVFLDSDATRANISSTYLRYAKTAEPDSRLLVFFAGHGITRAGRTRDAGFLIPWDGNDDDLSTLIGWNELVMNAELIRAKHIFFVMDSCYGGTLFNRAISPGGVRFLKDMMIRPVRQALTAGKHDEQVADGGGPRPSHSVFTGHLLNALEGAARAPEGHLTASGVMAYVYKHVASDIHSKQTPHYGFLTGDGDFIFDAPQLKSLEPSDTSEQDALVTVAATEIPEQQAVASDPFGLAKQYLSEAQSVIRLHDLVMKYTRKLIVETSKESFPLANVEFTVEELTRRVRDYENATQELRGLLECIAYWRRQSHHSILSKALSRTTDHLGPEGGLNFWISLRWYPSILLTYAGGIAAVANRQYENLQAIFGAPIAIPHRSFPRTTLVETICDEIGEIESMDTFKRLPGHERYYTPRSEYLFKLLQPELDDDLFLGNEYEQTFDRFELLLALVSAVHRKRADGRVWGPVGRFGWKAKRRLRNTNPFTELLTEAKEKQSDWHPFKAGLFGSDFQLFLAAALDYEKLVAELNWW